MQEVIPERLIRLEQRDNFLAWLRGLRIDTQDKKQLLMFWADRVDTKVTGDMVKRAGID
jgi:hypothetical protein